jgi:hypothetical protein
MQLITVHSALTAAAVASKHASKLGEVAASISSSAQERLAQQGPALPAAKQLDVPQPELVGQLCCPPELVLVEHFRVQRKQILEVRLCNTNVIQLGLLS